MTDILDELERLHAAATAGAWRVHDNPRYWAELPDDITEDGKDANRDANAAFVVATHNHLPVLLATLREMREALEQIRDAGHENGNICDVELADGRDCDCTRSLAVAALERARERLGAK